MDAQLYMFSINLIINCMKETSYRDFGRVLKF